MEFSWNYRDTMYRQLTRDCSISQNCTTKLTTISKYIEVDLSGDIAEIPSFFIDYPAEVIKGIEKLIIPLTVNSNMHYTYSGAETILRNFGRCYAADGRLVTISSKKNETYYGTYGTILDKNFNPLMFVTKKMSIDHQTGHTNILPNSRIVYLSPKVFLNDTDTLCKHLSKKTLAFCLNDNILAQYSVQVPEIRIAEPSILKTASKPLQGDNTSKINEMLKENIDEFLTQIKYD